MKVLASTLPNIELTKEKLEAFKYVLGDLTEEQFTKGLDRLVKGTRKIYPGDNVAAIIREYALNDPLQYLTAAEAWEIVRKGVPRFGGSYGRPNFKDPVIQKTVQAIGWQDICQGNPSVVRGQFLKMYDQIVLREKEQLVFG